MINRTAVALVALWAGLLYTQAVATPPPPCPDCTSGTWPNCTSDCTAGQDCCNEENCEECVGTACLVCGGDTSKTCCEGDCCSSNQCCTDSGCVYCDGDDECCLAVGGCAVLSRDWSITGTISVDFPEALLSQVNAAVNTIPGVSGVAFTGGSGNASVRQRECCDQGSIKYETCGDYALVIEAELGTIQIWGLAFSEGVNFSGFGVEFGAIVSFDLGANITGKLAFGATGGIYDNPCGEGCPYGSVDLTGSLAVNIGGSACCCVRIWGSGRCSPEISAYGSATLSFGGGVGINGCGDCDNSHFSFEVFTVVGSISVKMGSYTASFSKTLF